MSIVELTQAEYAARRRVTPRAIDKAIVAGRIPASAVRRVGRSKLIDVAAADLALGQAQFRVNTPTAAELDAAAAAAAAAALASAAPSETANLTRARAVVADYDARLKELEYREQLNTLRSVLEVERAIDKLGEAMVNNLSQLAARADDLATAFTRNGVSGVRALLKDLVREIRRSIEQTCLTLADDDERAAMVAGDLLDEADEFAS